MIGVYIFGVIFIFLLSGSHQTAITDMCNDHLCRQRISRKQLIACVVDIIDEGATLSQDSALK